MPVNHHVCTPFGCYYYENLRPQLFGAALFVPFAWAIFGFVSYLTARHFIENKTSKIVFAAVLMVILDLSIDPIMTSWRAWVWETTTGINWFGIPWTNYLGWLIVSLTFFSIYERFSQARIEEGASKARPPNLPPSVKTPTEAAFLISVAAVLFPSMIREMFSSAH